MRAIPQKTVILFVPSQEKSVADIIYDQLGGDSFAKVFGATNFIKTEFALSFSIPGENANLVRITYNYGMDEYDIEFEKVSMKGVEKVYCTDGIYSDQLVEVVQMYI